ncbi:MAG TPA: TIGR04283 family arsenosugar biosynthesis glycosyltransferase [Chryseolinea sp.]|jgi:rSAM/selenodomain-associated transferase 2|nr:TIGR04283 family arsenosugar biosynthesis glycosyltransferase [Chryseolinea sp.]
MISVIIPTYNEEHQIEKTVQTIFKRGGNLISEIIISDGGSNDQTIVNGKLSGAKIILSKKGRAIQLNKGAQHATQAILYFIHSDSIPPEGFAKMIVESVKNDFVSGCFRLGFDLDNWFLKSQCWFTKFDINAFRYGDQSLFVTRDVFLKSGGYNENLIVMEDNEIIPRLKKYGRFQVIDSIVTTSARKYIENGIYKTQLVFYFLFLLYKLGYSQVKIIAIFKKLIKQNKI